MGFGRDGGIIRQRNYDRGGEADNSDRPQLWVAVAKPDQAATLVLSEVPEGWTADVLEAAPTEALLRDLRKLSLRPGEVRKQTK